MYLVSASFLSNNVIFFRYSDFKYAHIPETTNAFGLDFFKCHFIIVVADFQHRLIGNKWFRQHFCEMANMYLNILYIWLQFLGQMKAMGQYDTNNIFFFTLMTF